MYYMVNSKKNIKIKMLKGEYKKALKLMNQEWKKWTQGMSILSFIKKSYKYGSKDWNTAISKNLQKLEQIL